MPALTSFLCLLLPADHVALGCDVSKEQEVQKTFETIQRTCGNVTYLVNAAGINRCVVHVDISAEDFVTSNVVKAFCKPVEATCHVSSTLVLAVVR